MLPLIHAAFLASSMSAAAAAVGLFLLAAEIIRAKGQNAIASRRMKRKKKKSALGAGTRSESMRPPTKLQWPQRQ
jgi:predicted hydrolase (HD superfamily)